MAVKRSQTLHKPRRTTKTLPAWVRAIPQSQAHGSGHLQKRLWRVVSDFVRLRDWYKYGGKCVATGVIIPHWTQGNAGHFKAYSKCNGLYKFDEQNIHLQSASSNAWGDYDHWKAFEAELRRRGYAVDNFDLINRSHSLKFTNEDIMNQMKWILSEMKGLPEQPDYYLRASTLLGELQ